MLIIWLRPTNWVSTHANAHKQHTRTHKHKNAESKSAEEYLLPLESPHKYRRHDGSYQALCGALLGLLGDHLALDALVGVYAKACRCCFWPKEAVVRTKQAAAGIVHAITQPELKKAEANDLAAYSRQHICKVIMLFLVKIVVSQPCPFFIYQIMCI